MFWSWLKGQNVKSDRSDKQQKNLFCICLFISMQSMWQWGRKNEQKSVGTKQQVISYSIQYTDTGPKKKSICEKKREIEIRIMLPLTTDQLMCVMNKMDSFLIFFFLSLLIFRSKHIAMLETIRLLKV